MYMMRVYPTFDEVKEDFTKDELLEFIDYSITGKDINTIIDEYIKDNYEYKLVADEDKMYDEYIDNLLTGDD